MSIRTLTERLEILEARRVAKAPVFVMVFADGYGETLFADSECQQPISLEDQAKIDAGAHVLMVRFIDPEPPRHD